MLSSAGDGGRKDPETVPKLFDNRSGKVAKALGEKTIFYGQATKGIRWMPWRTRAKKDVVSCDKPR